MISCLLKRGSFHGCILKGKTVPKWYIKWKTTKNYPRKQLDLFFLEFFLPTRMRVKHKIQWTETFCHSNIFRYKSMNKLQNALGVVSSKWTLCDVPWSESGGKGPRRILCLTCTRLEKFEGPTIFYASFKWSFINYILHIFLRNWSQLGLYYDLIGTVRSSIERDQGALKAPEAPGY